MAGLDELVQLFGLPAARETSPDDWSEVENHLGSALPGDFKAFLDAYGTGAICGELVVFHPLGSSPLLILEPADLDELADCGEIGPVEPKSEPF
ncbi:hypothetical protein ABZY57_04630 [Streptomyces sp. NPDC006450]|uniref:hypothetical protein n=1 Tax=Streptomyces sp. NPDC006450 TaxID=3155458 RepID=UPI0033ABEC1F